MAKKKKKRASNSTQNDNSSTHSSPSRQWATTSVASSTDSTVDVLELKLHVPAQYSESANAPLKRIDAVPSVSLSEHDSRQISVGPKDEIILLVQQGLSATITVTAGALICRANILSAGAPSPGTPNNKSRGVTYPGHCQVDDSSLTNLMRRDEPGNNVQDEEQVVQPHSSSKSGFSFAIGGGGGEYLSPLTPSRNSSSPRTPKSSTSLSARSASVSVLAVPVLSELGQKVASIVCQTATQVHVQLAPTANLPGGLDTRSQILAQLLLAQCVGRYVRCSDTLVISFQGKPLELQIRSVEGDGQSLEQRCQKLLELELARLAVNDDDAACSNLETRMWGSIRSDLESPEKSKRILLSKIAKDTKIAVWDDSANRNGDLHLCNPENEVQSTSINKSTHVQSFVAGLSATLEQVRSLLLTPLLRPELFARGSLKAPRGVLLYGPHGTGKSLIAQQIAHDFSTDQTTAVKVQSINCASLQSYSSSAGEAERRLTRIFHNASLSQPGDERGQKCGTLMIFDDIHLICPKRSGYNPGSDRLSATLLSLLDSIGSSSSTENESPIAPIVILGITNNPSLLDPALRRPGRLDAEVEVPIPDEASTRAEILRFQLDQHLGGTASKANFSDDQVTVLATNYAKGFTGADCVLAIKEALRSAILRRPADGIACESSSGESRQLAENDATSDWRGQLSFEDVKSAMQGAKPSAIRAVTIEIPKVYWSSIGGMDDVKRQLREALELPVSHAHLFRQLRISPPRGILLYGPPGCSKTLLARAIATEGSMNFLAVKGPELLSKWLGESERALASLFRRARMASPCIIFFDEVDAIASARGSAGIGSGGGRLLSQLLTELDGVNSTGSVTGGGETTGRKVPRVVVVGATNRPDLLDSALMRPGRIDRKIYVGVPDEQSRSRIFEIGLKGKAGAEYIDIPTLARDELSGGFSGAELIAVCRDAALLALEDEHPAEAGSAQLCMRHMLQAIKGMQRQITPEMLEFYNSFRISRE